GDVLEEAFAVVAVELQRGRPLALVTGPVAGIDEQQILVAVIIKVKEGDTGAHRLGQQLLAEGAVGVAEANAGLVGDVGEADLRHRCSLQGRQSALVAEVGRLATLLALGTAAQAKQHGQEEHGSEDCRSKVWFYHDPFSQGVWASGGVNPLMG